jgi:hypothetical protein
MRLSDIRSGLKRGREERRRVLTRGERVFAWSYTVLSSLLIPAGVVLLLAGSGATHGVGIALLVIGLLAMAVPISPLLRARVRRRESQAARDEKVEQAFEVLVDDDLSAREDAWR